MAEPRPGEHVDLEWLLASTRSRYKGGVHLRAEVLVDGAPYRFLLEGDRAAIERGAVARPELQVRISARALAGLLLHGWPEDDASPAEAIEGDTDGLRTLVDAFERPSSTPSRQ